MQPPAVRFPAEWESQSAVLIAWPHAGTDWAERLRAVEQTYTALVAAITRFQMVLICVADEELQTHVRTGLSALHVDMLRVDMLRVGFVIVDYDDTWLRDSGPVTLVASSQAGVAPAFQLLDFRFTGWGGKFDARQDDQLVRRLANAGMFLNSSVQHIDFALEGGAIDTDGAGTVLTTWQCLHQRHPMLTREALSALLQQWLQQQRILWLEHGALLGDDTDAHIDTLARFACTDAIVYQACEDPADAHYQDLQAMAAELAALRTQSGTPYRLFPLPWPRPILDRGRRLAASYANFLIINGAVLMPCYDDAADHAAQAVLARAFPDREIVRIPCRDLIWQNGSLHCITMQLPAGLVAWGG